jgi:RHS repeat-associated protein
VSRWTWGNATLAVRTYDTDGKITQVDSGGLDTYAYDDAFRITAITDTVNGANSYAYGFDALDRLTSAVKTGTTRGWSYDANGNRLSETGSFPSTYTISGTSNRLSSISGTLSRSYGYDASGNVLTDGNLTATYNNRGRLSTLTANGSTETILYNALGERVKVSGGARGTVLYLYDEAGHLLGEYDGSGNLLEETVWLGDIPVATLRPNGSTVSVYYVHTDHLNTPRRVTRPSDNAVLWTWYADPFGSKLPNENPQGAGTFSYNLRFPGQVYDPQAGLSYNYFRDYDPQVGRYVESDSLGLGGGLSTYTYVSDDPIELVDPEGLYQCTCSIGAHEMSCTPNDPSHPAFRNARFVSGNNESSSCPDRRDNPKRTGVQDHGPLPMADYSIGPALDALGRRDLTPIDPTQMGRRYGMQLHGCSKPESCSNGCIAAIPNKVRDRLNQLLHLEEGHNTLKVVP